MNVATFLHKANALKGRGPLALFSGDFKLLKGEVQAAGRAYRADITAAQRAGRAPHSCPPRKVGLSPDEVLANFNAIPPAQRTMSVKTAFYDMMKRKYPCPSG